MPLPFAILVGFATGASFAGLARKTLVRDEDTGAMERLWSVVLGFTVAAVLPAVAWPVAFHGDWAWVFATPWRDVPPTMDVLAIAIAVGQVPLGFALGVRAVRERREDRLRAFVAVPMLLAVGLGVALRERLSVSATYAQLHGGFGIEPIGASALGRTLVFLAGVFVMGVALAVRGVRR
ncbi:MAG: hypothetical protein U0169_02775 [Polyangiaceae bacterium]